MGESDVVILTSSNKKFKIMSHTTTKKNGLIIYSDANTKIFKNGGTDLYISKYYVFDTILSKLKEELKKEEIIIEDTPFGSTDSSLRSTEHCNGKIYYKLENATNSIYRTEKYGDILSAINEVHTILDNKFEEIHQATSGIIYDSSYSFIYRFLKWFK